MGIFAVRFCHHFLGKFGNTAESVSQVGRTERVVHVVIAGKCSLCRTGIRNLRIQTVRQFNVYFIQRKKFFFEDVVIFSHCSTSFYRR